MWLCVCHGADGMSGTQARDFIFIPNRVYPTSYQREAKKKKKVRLIVPITNVNRNSH